MVINNRWCANFCFVAILTILLAGCVRPPADDDDQLHAFEAAILWTRNDGRVLQIDLEFTGPEAITDRDGKIRQAYRLTETQPGQNVIHHYLDNELSLVRTTYECVSGSCVPQRDASSPQDPLDRHEWIRQGRPAPFGLGFYWSLAQDGSLRDTMNGDRELPAGIVGRTVVFEPQTANLSRAVDVAPHRYVRGQLLPDIDGHQTVTHYEQRGPLQPADVFPHKVPKMGPLGASMLFEGADQPFLGPIPPQGFLEALKDGSEPAKNLLQEGCVSRMIIEPPRPDGAQLIEAYSQRAQLTINHDDQETSFLVSAKWSNLESAQYEVGNGQDGFSTLPEICDLEVQVDAVVPIQQVPTELRSFEQLGAVDAYSFHRDGKLIQLRHRDPATGFAGYSLRVTPDWVGTENATSFTSYEVMMSGHGHGLEWALLPQGHLP